MTTTPDHAQRMREVYNQLDQLFRQPHKPEDGEHIIGKAIANAIFECADIVEARANDYYNLPFTDEEDRVLAQRLGNVLHHAAEAIRQRGKGTP